MCLRKLLRLKKQRLPDLHNLDYRNFIRWVSLRGRTDIPSGETVVKHIRKLLDKIFSEESYPDSELQEHIDEVYRFFYERDAAA